MDSNRIREVFLEYFSHLGYRREHSASLIPAGDPTLLFTNAGMVPFKKVFQGLEDFPASSACSSQKCIRAGGKHNDLEQVGFTARHHTFFEMLGHFVFKDATKKDAIAQAWDLLTKGYGIPEEKLWVTVFEDDAESRAIWHKHIGLSHDRIIDCGAEDNFWSMGATGPCGPCTEIFYDHGPDVSGGLPGSDEQDGDRYTEIWNLVFMQYNMAEDGSRTDLPNLGVDTGMGLERLAAVLQGVHNNFDTDLFAGIIEGLHQQYGQIDLMSSRVIADHLRSAVFLITDQVYPSNEGRGYVLRRIIRRAISFGYRSGIQTLFLNQLVDLVLEKMGAAFPEIVEKADIIKQVIREEEERFQLTLNQGMRLLESNIEKGEGISGKTAFTLYDTYGFPLDMTKDIAREKNLSVDEVGYQEAMTQQQERSRAHSNFSVKTHELPIQVTTEFQGYDSLEGSGKVLGLVIDQVAHECLKTGTQGMILMSHTPFYPEGGGQVGDVGTISTDSGQFMVSDTQKFQDTIVHHGHVEKGHITLNQVAQLLVDKKRRATMGNHSATHLLHAALRHILGDHVIQKGSLVDHERLRFDFTHHSPLTPQEVEKVEWLVNEHIQYNHPRQIDILPLAEARKKNVMALFDEKYEDPVRIIQFGAFSAELCGGTHVQHTGQIGLLKIVQETGIASGVRRIEAITGMQAIHWLQNVSAMKRELSEVLKTDQDSILSKANSLVLAHKELGKAYEHLERERYVSQIPSWVKDADQVDQQVLLNKSFKDLDLKSLRVLYDAIRREVTSGIILLTSEQSDGTAVVLIGVLGDSLKTYSASALMRDLTDKYGGRGGGKPDLCQGKIQHYNQFKDDPHYIRHWAQEN